MTIREWVEALESGMFKQGQNALLREDRYCCLGVACEVAGVEWHLDEGVYTAEYKGKNGWCALPEPLRQELKLSTWQQCELMNMNDVTGSTFREIAQQLRKWFPGEFTQ